MLQGTGRMIVVEVESGLAEGNYAGVLEQLTKPRLRVLAPLVGVVRMDPGGGNEPGLVERGPLLFPGSNRHRSDL